MFDRVPFYGQVLMFSGLALALVAGAYWFMPGLSDMKKNIADLEQDYQRKEKEIHDGRAIEQRLPEFERKLERKRDELAELESILPTNRETGDLLRWIKNLGDRTNLELKSFAPGTLRPVEFYNEFPIDMQIAARYHDLGLFLDEVSGYDRIINVDNLRITAQQDGEKTIGATFTATTFVQDDEVPSEEEQL